MALFQVLRGKAEKLLKKKFHDGYVYFTPDDGAIHIDVETDGEQKRMHVNPTAYQQAVEGGFEGTEEEFQKLTAMLPQFETTEHKDIDGINNPDSTDHYPSTKAMADYVNSQILAGKEIFVVNWTASPEVCQADKTYEEIKSALENDVVTVIGKTENDGQTYATHEITIATGGKIYFRFVWYDETRGTMEKYFYLQDNEYGGSTNPQPVSQQDWAENNEESASYVKNRPGAYDITDDRIMEVNLVAAPIGRPENEKNYADFVYTDISRIYACLVSTNIVGLRDACNTRSIYFTDKGNSSDIKEPLHLSSDGKYIYSENYDREYDSSVGDKRVFKILIALEDNLTIYKITYPKAGIYAANTPDQAGTYWHDSMAWVSKVTTKVKIPNEYIDAPQADYAENDSTAPDYIKNRPGGYNIKTEKTATVTWADRPSDAIVTDPPRSLGSDIIFYGYLITEDIEGFEKALQNGTVVVDGNKHFKSLIADAKWIKTNQTYALGTDSTWDSNTIHCIAVLLEDGVVYDGLTYPKKGIYAASAYYPGSGAYNTKGFSSISWSWTEESIIEIPLKYQEKETFLCTFTSSDGSTIECDKTFEELNAASNAGKNVVGVFQYPGLPIVYATPIVDIGPGDAETSLIFTFMASVAGANVQLAKIAVAPEGCKKLGFRPSGPNNVMEPIYCNFTFNHDKKAFECDIDYDTIRQMADMALPVIGSVNGLMVYFAPARLCFVAINPNEAKDSLEAGFLVYNSTSKKWDFSDPISLGGSSNSATAVDAIGDLYETGILTPAQQDGTFYTAPTGEVYTI